MIILIFAGGIIPGSLFILSGYLIFRESHFDFHYFFDFKTDSIKKGLFTTIILFCFILTIATIGATGGVTPVKSQFHQVAVSEGNNPDVPVQSPIQMHNSPLTFQLLLMHL